MCYIRGHPLDYDRWAEKTKDEKFRYKNVLPLFKKSQNAHEYGSDDFNGRQGELDTSKPDMTGIPWDDLTKAFIQAGINTGNKL